jgi:hypothetical protein
MHPTAAHALHGPTPPTDARVGPPRRTWRTSKWICRAILAGVLLTAGLVPAGPAWADSVTVSPTANGLTFGAQVQNVLNWTAQGALWACLASILIGAGAWGLSKHFGNYGGAHKGLQLVIGGAIGALVVATAPAIVNSMFTG